MAGATATETDAGFGRVSRTVGLVFQYLLLAATLAGIVALAVLLVFVTNDAIRPLSAEPAWLATAVAAILLAPLAVAGWLGRRRPAEFRFGVAALGLLTIGVLYGGGMTIVFIDVIPTLVWLGYAVALVVPVAVMLLIDRLDRSPSFLVRTAAVVGVGALSLWQVPRLVLSLPTLPADWLVLWVTLGGPAAALAAWYVRGRVEAPGVGRWAGVLAMALIGAAGAVGLATGVGGRALVVFASVGIMPALVYAGVAVYERGRAAVGLALPAVALGGVLAVLGAERVLGLAGPDAWLTWGFLTSTQASPPAETAGIYAGIVGTILLMVTVAVVSFPVGVGAAVYLEEYAPDTRFTRIIDVNISNLAGVPSVVYGLLGLGAFIRFGGLAPGTVVVGGLTLALLILPIVIISAREAIRGVPDSRRRAAYGMGATRWQAVRTVVLPEAFPGILTGTILALGRAVGETAPLLVIGAPAIFGVPDALGDRVGAIPLQIYAWASTFGSEAFYTTVLAAGVVTILVILLTMNSIAIVLRNKYQRDP